MGWDAMLTDPVTGTTLELEEPHQMRGGTYCVGGTRRAKLSVTYNYGKHYARVMRGGLDALDGMSGAESISILTAAIEALGRDVDKNYWVASEGNARLALEQLRALARLRPDGVWRLS